MDTVRGGAMLLILSSYQVHSFPVQHVKFQSTINVMRSLLEQRVTDQLVCTSLHSSISATNLLSERGSGLLLQSSFTCT